MQFICLFFFFFLSFCLFLCVSFLRSLKKKTGFPLRQALFFCCFFFSFFFFSFFFFFFLVGFLLFLSFFIIFLSPGISCVSPFPGVSLCRPGGGKRGGSGGRWDGDAVPLAAPRGGAGGQAGGDGGLGDVPWSSWSSAVASLHQHRSGVPGAGDAWGISVLISLGQRAPSSSSSSSSRGSLCSKALPRPCVPFPAPLSPHGTGAAPPGPLPAAVQALDAGPGAPGGSGGAGSALAVARASLLHPFVSKKKKEEKKKKKKKSQTQKKKKKNKTTKPKNPKPAVPASRCRGLHLLLLFLFFCDFVFFSLLLFPPFFFFLFFFFFFMMIPS
ncbi:uncharacterized protein LOC131093778 [Melospiza georgiana]|uniref:uncharacterized protein LOC131093778 n=1 Tax=Melospiza georgiana TaxID=44398 RepID=UPI0025AC2E58|nr:uncharacterized protein LOC131093778 [Melospiza georgiana]